MASHAALRYMVRTGLDEVRRGTRRSQAALPVLIRLMGRSHAAKLRNLSHGGAMIETELRLFRGDEIEFNCGGIEVRARVVWQTGTNFGLQFCTPIPDRDLRAQILRADLLADRRTMRREPSSIN